VLSLLAYGAIAWSQGDRPIPDREPVIPDLPATHWFYEGVAISKKAGLLNDYLPKARQGNRLLFESEGAEMLFCITKGLEFGLVALINSRDRLVSSAHDAQWQADFKEFSDYQKHVFAEKRLSRFLRQATAFLDVALSKRGMSSQEIDARVTYALSFGRSLRIPSTYHSPR
jgi:hypothetical protein